MSNTEKNERTPVWWVGIAKVAAVASAVFCVAVITLLIATYAQMTSADPLETKALEALREQYADHPRDPELKEEIRALDFLARKAYFTGQRQLQTGALLLCGGLVVLLLSLHLLMSGRREVHAPGTCPGVDDPWTAAVRSRHWLTALAVAVGGISLLLSFMWPDKYATIPLAGDQTGAAAQARVAGAEDSEGQAIEAVPAVTLEEMRNNWPSFRGFGGLGVVQQESTPPLEWNGESGKNIIWKTEVPLPGFSSPVVWKKKVFLSGGSKEKRQVFCFSAETGELLWERAVTGIPGSPEEPPAVTADTGYAAPTMAVDGQRAFAIFATGDVVCYTLAGERVWAKNIGVPDNHYGHSSSLLTYDDLLIIQYDHFGGPRVLALESGTGDVSWEYSRDVEISWASPIVVRHEQGDKLVLNASPYVVCYSPSIGLSEWSAECMSGEVGPSPSYAGGLVFVANQYASLSAVDANTGEVSWQNFDAELPDVSSPVAFDDYLVMAASSGVVTCLRAGTGDVLWTQEFEHGFYSSPIYAAGRVYLLDKTGVMHVFKAGESYEALGEAPLGEPSVCTPAFSEGRIFIRGSKHLFCIGEAEK